MSWNSKVVWSEGLFLRPQHFQQQDRHCEAKARLRMRLLHQYSWGFNQLEIDRGLLKSGKVALLSAQGIMPDGTLFSIPEDASPPTPIDLDETVRDCLIYLALPVEQPGAVEIDAPDGREATARLVTNHIEVRDSNQGARTVAEIDVARHRVCLLPETSDLGGYVKLGALKIVEVRADGHVVIDSNYMPTSLDCHAVPELRAFMTELLGSLHQRREALANYLKKSGVGTMADINDLLMLQMINRYHPLLNHFFQTANLHPNSLYHFCTQLIGELSTFTSEQKWASSMPPYRHDDLASSFRAPIEALRMSLSTVLEQKAVLIPLHDERYGVKAATVGDRDLLRTATFVLGCKSDLPTEVIHQILPGRAKICSVERIREMINLSLPGIGLHSLPTAPREIPHHLSAAYFELDRSSALWGELSQSGGIAIHLSGEVSNMELSLWAIREQEAP
ncbi:MAG: type VI secretion system baseplate subunit TssK [Geminicoccaceae bacterium]